MPIVGRAANGNVIAVTWGKTQEMTRKFYEAYNDEAYAYYCPEYINAGKLSPRTLTLLLLKLSYRS